LYIFSEAEIVSTKRALQQKTTHKQLPKEPRIEQDEAIAMDGDVCERGKHSHLHQYWVIRKMYETKSGICIYK
jgi:hypothetical protein